MSVSLYSLNPGETGIITEISQKFQDHSQSSVLLRMRNLGFLPGISVTCTGVSIFGSPKSFCICGTCIALRPSDANAILIQKI
ncbi:MAG: ferrous iron transport protein A [Blautia sp.]